MNDTLACYSADQVDAMKRRIAELEAELAPIQEAEEMGIEWKVYRSVRHNRSSFLATAYEPLPPHNNDWEYPRRGTEEATLSEALHSALDKVNKDSLIWARGKKKDEC